jgi:hypothetical protein
VRVAHSLRNGSLVVLSRRRAVVQTLTNTEKKRVLGRGGVSVVCSLRYGSLIVFEKPNRSSFYIYMYIYTAMAHGEATRARSPRASLEAALYG